MKINKSIIADLRPCADRFNNFIANNGDKDFDLKSFISLDNITYDDKVWVVTRLFTKEQNVRWSIACAESTLVNFEKYDSNDKRPRKAIEAALAYLNNPCDKTKAAAYSAHSAACSAAHSAAYSAAYSAHSAARSAYSAAYSADSAARSADSAARSAAEKDQEKLNLLFMLEAE